MTNVVTQEAFLFTLEVSCTLL